MTSMKAVLQNACAVNDLGVSGSNKQLLTRLLKFGDSKNKSKTHNKHAPKTSKTPKIHKKVKASPMCVGGTCRLSAKQYFEQIADKKLKNCKPQWIPQPNGSVVLKMIKKCDDAWGGRCVKWIAVSD